MTTTTPQSTVTANHKQRLYVIPTTQGGFSCHGFDVVEKLISRLVAEGLTPPPFAAEVGTAERYEQYRTLCAEGCKKSASGWKSTAELTPELIGKEGRRVEVTHQWRDGEAETVRFQVSRSTGWMPCHLQLARRGVSGGPAVCLGKILSVRIVG
jgi:hypothetical protein